MIQSIDGDPLCELRPSSCGNARSAITFRAWELNGTIAEVARASHPKVALQSGGYSVLPHPRRRRRLNA